MRIEHFIETMEVSMLEPEIVLRIRVLRSAGWGTQRIADDVGVSRKAVKRYLAGALVGVQRRPRARRLDDENTRLARSLFVDVAEGNAVVVVDELAKRGIVVSERTVQRVVADVRRERAAVDVATTRFESEPGEQMQIDFGQKRVVVGGNEVVVHLMAAVLGYSRRCFVRAFLAERAEEWREGIAAAFRHFGGVTHTLLIDNSRCLVLEHSSSRVVLQPALVELARDFGFTVQACRPYRARTKGKVESGVKFVKRNALAGRSFSSFAELEAHLVSWMAHVDERVHGTTHEAPSLRFEAEGAALLPLPSSSVRARGERRFERKVSNDAFVDVDSVRYSVPMGHVGQRVAVFVDEQRVRVERGPVVVAEHARSNEPYARVEQAAHRVGVLRSSTTTLIAAPPTPHGRSLEIYAEVIKSSTLPRPSGLSSADSPPIPKRIGGEIRGQGESLDVVATGGAS